MKKFYVLLIGFCVFTIVGCVGKSIESKSGNLKTIDFKKKVDIIQRYEDKESSLSIMLYKLSEEWPLVYLQENEEKLLHYYSEFTWHVEDFEIDNLLSNIENHKEFLKVRELYRNGSFPADNVELKSLNVISEDDGYIVEAVYVINSDGNLIEENIVFTVGPTMELFNKNFLSFKDYGELPPSSPERDKQMLSYLLFDSLSINQKLKMTLKEKNTLLDFTEN